MAASLKRGREYETMGALDILLYRNLGPPSREKRIISFYLFLVELTNHFLNPEEKMEFLICRLFGTPDTDASEE